MCPSFGLIATEKGFNIFVGGNGGAKPRHAELLAKDVPPTEVIPILDRYLMFYIRTADKLQRTAPWLESLPGGIKYLRSVVLDDALGIAAALEAQMQTLVDSFFDEWAEAINTPSIAAKFRQFANTSETLPTIELEEDRSQLRPVMWPKNAPTITEPSSSDPEEKEEKPFPFSSLPSTWSSTTWTPVLPASYFAGADALPNGISATVKISDTQLAVFRLRGRYYATQQMCPHKRAFILSDSLVGQSEPKDGENKSSSLYISCPHHKRNFDLTSGACSNDTSGLSIATFEVEEKLIFPNANSSSISRSSSSSTLVEKVEEEGADSGEVMVCIKLPPDNELDAALGTKKWMVKKGEAGKGQFEEVDKKIGFDGQRRKGRKPGVVRVVNGHGKAKENGECNGNGKVVDGTNGVRKVEVIVGGGGGGCGGAPEW